MDVKDTLIRFAKPGVGSKFRFMSLWEHGWLTPGRIPPEWKEK
jgi:hypothetical protein